jgi:hypothetical protein
MRIYYTASILLILQAGNVHSYKLPRPIAALLSSVETQEIQRDAFTISSPEYSFNLNRFRSLAAPVHAALHHSKALPQCLGKSNSPEFLSYDNKCEFSVTPSEYCCEVYAEQACADPAMHLVTAQNIVMDRIEGLDGAANPFLYSSCMLNKCSDACSTTSNDYECKSCSNICQRFCLSNLTHLCMKRTCGQNIVMVAESAMVHGKRQKNSLLHEQTEKDVQNRLKLSQSDIRKIEKSEIVKFSLSVLDRKASVPLCSDSALIDSDVAAKVEVNKAGTTFMESLIACNTQYLSANKLDEIIKDPTILGRSDECSVTATCERNHIQLAMDRAESQVKVIKSHRAAMLAHGYV